MDVRRRPDGRADPSFDHTWSDLDKLRWKAGIVYLECGVDITITTRCYSYRFLWRDIYPSDAYGIDVPVPGGSAGHLPLRFNDAWEFMNGVVAGTQAVALTGDSAPF
jgi:hypothetical protein